MYPALEHTGIGVPSSCTAGQLLRFSTVELLIRTISIMDTVQNTSTSRRAFLTPN